MTTESRVSVESCAYVLMTSRPFSSLRDCRRRACHCSKNKKAITLWTTTPLYKTMLRFKSTVLSVLLLSLGYKSDAFVQQNGARAHHYQSSSTRLSVVNDVTEKKDHVPYEIARGDGSTGGGGLPMPSASQDGDGLVRPKVSCLVWR
jgi:hypothetical protein